jgi:hypothetical protein
MYLNSRPLSAGKDVFEVGEGGGLRKELQLSGLLSTEIAITESRFFGGRLL